MRDPVRVDMAPAAEPLHDEPEGRRVATMVVAVGAALATACFAMAAPVHATVADRMVQGSARSHSVGLPGATVRRVFAPCCASALGLVVAGRGSHALGARVVSSAIRSTGLGAHVSPHALERCRLGAVLLAAGDAPRGTAVGRGARAVEVGPGFRRPASRAELLGRCGHRSPTLAGGKARTGVGLPALLTSGVEPSRVPAVYVEEISRVRELATASRAPALRAHGHGNYTAACDDSTPVANGWRVEG